MIHDMTLNKQETVYQVIRTFFPTWLWLILPIALAKCFQTKYKCFRLSSWNLQYGLTSHDILCANLFITLKCFHRPDEFSSDYWFRYIYQRKSPQRFNVFCCYFILMRCFCLSVFDHHFIVDNALMSLQCMADCFLIWKFWKSLSYTLFL